MGKEWRFTQLGGAGRTLTLVGACAPHGRLRKEPVVSDGIKLRKQRVYYPDGGNAPPTTHVFGTEWKDWDLKGRMSDRELGPGGTKAAIRDWQTFVAEGQEVEIRWGDIIAARGLIDEFTPGRESEAACSYALVVLIDRQEIESSTTSFDVPKAPLAMCQELQVELDEGIVALPTLPNAGDLKPSFLDSLEEAVSNINGFSASMLRIAGEIDAFTEGTFDQLERLRAGVAQMRTAVNHLRGTIETTQDDAALFADAADAEVQWFAARANVDVSSMRMLAILEEIDRETELARRGRVLAIYLARAGDSWESIASRFYGGPDGAGRIRDANGITYGELPTPGREYTIPVAA